MVRIYLFLCLMLALLSGCGHVRVSGKYGDCAPYVRTKEQVYRKFYIRSLNVYNWPGKNFLFGGVDHYFKGEKIFITSDKICQYIDDMFVMEPQHDDIPVDVIITFCGNERTFGLWSIPLAWTFVLAQNVGKEFYFEIEVSVDGDNRLSRMKSQVRVHDIGAVFPTGLLYPPPALPDGSQISDLRKYCFEIPELKYDLTEILVKTVAYGVAQQLKTYALDRLTMPDIDFK